jgi:hypothetical protein
MKNVLVRTFGAAVAAIAISGCASIANQTAMDTERRLSAAGFQMKLADTPAKMARLKTMTERKVVATTMDGETAFVYADAVSCKCVYVGSEKNYQEYQRLSIQQNIVNEQRLTAETSEANEMNWNAWGAWPRPRMY